MLASARKAARTLDRDTENSPALHELIKKADIILPWAVGRYEAGFGPARPARN
ncbi:MAG TPA: hypothetical protein VD772_09315 [Anseongella sp.]|nr:hypothetical protein [Anseongella sp.]